MIAPSEDYLSLATTLLDELSDHQSSTETVLLQLQALFGPMLTSALQLVDKREVVRVSLPSDRSVYQVSGSTGKPYTLHIDLPEVPSAMSAATSTTRSVAGMNSSTATINQRLSDEAQSTGHLITASQDDTARRRRRLMSEATAISRLYCPCPGYAYNSLAGDKNVLCKHLLAALIAAKTERAVKTGVPLHGVIDLLGLRSNPNSREEQEVT